MFIFSLFNRQLPVSPPISRLFWYAVFETLAVIAMAVYVYPPHFPSSLPLADG
jgi:hypothetical protein